MSGNSDTATKLIWAPQPGPQKALIDCPLPEVFFGGARGGGKTDGVLGKWALKEAEYGEAFNAVMYRRTTVSAEDAIERSKQIYGPLGGKFNESKLRWRLSNGGRVSFAYLDGIEDAQEYQGRNVTDAWVEEAGQYPTAAPIDRLQAVLRSATGVPTQLVLTANPGGPGQHWIKERYQLYPFPERPRVIRRTLSNGAVHMVAVIPSRITDNRVLLDNDPTYINRLHLVGSDELVRAWLEGDWSAVEGAFFDCWSERRHIVRPFKVPEHWLRFRSMDWGSAAPFSVGWWAVASEPYHVDVPARTAEGSLALSGERTVLPRGCLVRYREWYGEGQKLHAEAVAQGIRLKEAGDIDRAGASIIAYGVLDPSAFREDGGPSIAERMSREKVKFRPADNMRVGARGAMGGWDQMRARMVGDADGNPMVVCFSTCKDSIRTIPVLQHDPDRIEDLDTHTEDHAADDWRYACMSRPWTTQSDVPRERYRRDKQTGSTSAWAV